MTTRRPSNSLTTISQSTRLPHQALWLVHLCHMTWIFHPMIGFSTVLWVVETGASGSTESQVRSNIYIHIHYVYIYSGSCWYRPLHDGIKRQVYYNIKWSFGIFWDILGYSEWIPDSLKKQALLYDRITDQFIFSINNLFRWLKYINVDFCTFSSCPPRWALHNRRPGPWD